MYQGIAEHVRAVEIAAVSPRISFRGASSKILATPMSSTKLLVWGSRNSQPVHCAPLVN
jgi:hypothetical protein